MTENDVFVVNVAFCVVASVLLALVFVEAETAAARGPLLAEAEIALGRSSIWIAPQPSPRAALR